MLESTILMLSSSRDLFSFLQQDVFALASTFHVEAEDPTVESLKSLETLWTGGNALGSNLSFLTFSFCEVAQQGSEKDDVNHSTGL